MISTEQQYQDLTELIEEDSRSSLPFDSYVKSEKGRYGNKRRLDKEVCTAFFKGDCCHLSLIH